jgi:RecG-like helicase
LVDPLPEDIVRERNMVSEDEAIRAVHVAESEAERARALDRLRFDEAAGLQWALVSRRYGELSETGPLAPRREDGLAAALLRQLPFELTAGQREVLSVVSDELASTRPMNRMLQGEVGSGKTIVSLLAMMQMIDAGFQCAMLAPTEVLADQHARSMREVLGPLAMGGQLGGSDDATRVVLLTGSMSAAQKREVRAEIASGEAGIVIGTHALIQDAVEFRQLGMVVVDTDTTHGGAHGVRRPRDVHVAGAAARTATHHHQCDLQQGAAELVGASLAARRRRGGCRAAGLRRRAANRRRRQHRRGQTGAIRGLGRRSVRSLTPTRVGGPAIGSHARAAVAR